MNIEEEHKAFLIECQTMMGNAYYPTDTGFADGEFYDPTVQRLFAVWLAAKAHAVEMSKPTCKVMPGKNGEFWAFYYTDYEYQKGGFKTADDVRKWAKENGYRVIEE